MRGRIILAALLFSGSAGSPAAYAADTSQNCHGLKTPIGRAQLDRFYSLRAVEIIGRSVQPGWADDSALAEMVAPTAPIEAGYADFSEPFGPGPQGLHKLAAELRADRYRFDDWMGIYPPISDACAPHTVEVEFVESKASRYFRLKFSFEDGRLVRVGGWGGQFQAGDMSPQPAH